MVGDQESDMLAGKRAGCRTLYIHPDERDCRWADLSVATLWEGVQRILNASVDQKLELEAA
jgi:phosphoglycolate phosphatase-like HAD superfamily hydrolase